MPPAKRPLTHGTRHGYVHHACRCHACVGANAAYGRKLYRAAHGSSYVPRSEPHRANDSLYGKAIRPDVPADSWWCVAPEAFAAARDEQVPRLTGTRE